MIVKMRQSDGTFRLFDEVKGLQYTAPNTYLPAPAKHLKEDYAKLESWIEKIVAGGMKTGFPDDMEKDPDAPVMPEKHNLVMGVRQCDLAEDRKIYFTGEFGDLQASKHCFKFVVFMREDVEVWIYTDEPVYICNDYGKTIEVIR